MADRPQNHQRSDLRSQSVPTFVDDIYSRLHPIQADIVFVNQVHAVRGSQPQARLNRCPARQLGHASRSELRAAAATCPLTLFRPCSLLPRRTCAHTGLIVCPPRTVASAVVYAHVSALPVRRGRTGGTIVLACHTHERIARCRCRD